MALRIGRFRHRVGVLKPQRSRGASGAPVVTWHRVATRWGDVVPLSGTEIAEQERREARVTWRVNLRWYRGLSTTHRLELDGGEVLEIVDLRDPLQLKQYHEALCREVVDGQA